MTTSETTKILKTMIDSPPFIHPQALVETTAIGVNTRVWAFVHISTQVTIGSNCNICDHCFIESGVHIGNNVTVKSGVHIWTGVTIEDDVHLGPSVVFTNDRHPRSKQAFSLGEIRIKKGASIGANSTVLAGIEIGEYAMTGIGSVLTKNVKSHALVYGNPAKQQAWIDMEGNKITKRNGNQWIAENGDAYEETTTGLKKV
jgi:acetyltransferase-like isoleucine patch superfamily enzyme